MNFRKIFRAGNRALKVEPVEFPSIEQGHSGESIEPEVLSPSSKLWHVDPSYPRPSTRKLWDLGSGKTQR